MKTHYLKMYNKSFCAPWSSKKSGDSSDGGWGAVQRGGRYNVKAWWKYGNARDETENIERKKLNAHYRKIENGRQRKLRIFSISRWWNLLFFPSTRIHRVFMFCFYFLNNVHSFHLLFSWCWAVEHHVLYLYEPSTYSKEHITSTQLSTFGGWMTMIFIYSENIQIHKIQIHWVDCARI